MPCKNIRDWLKGFPGSIYYSKDKPTLSSVSANPKLLPTKSMKHRLRALFVFAVLVSNCIRFGARAESGLELKIASGSFEPTMESLTNYHCPDWFRDAKFGIWAHWGPQAVPMDGDWYARQMYQQGHAQYKDHLEHYGHPSTNGYKDIIPLWKAEKWDPERLMGLYKRAGAKYFVSMGSHHDNFFCGTRNCIVGMQSIWALTGMWWGHGRRLLRSTG